MYDIVSRRLLFAVGTLLLILFSSVVPCMGQQTKAEKARLASRPKRAARSLALLAANGGGALLDAEPKLDGVDDSLAAWLKQHKDAVVGASPSPFLKTKKWGVTTTNGNYLYLLLTGWPKGGKLTIPRLHNSIVDSMMMHNGEKVKVTSNVSDWEITLPSRPKSADTILPIVALQLNGSLTPIREGKTAIAPLVAPNDDGIIEIHARDSSVHGEMLRFEPQAHKNCIGYWVKEGDWVEWRFEADPKATYEVVLRYGCGEGQGGSELAIDVGLAHLSFVVEATGGFQTWREVSLGKVSELMKENVLTVRPKKKAKKAVMDLQQITLKPVSD